MSSLTDASDIRPNSRSDSRFEERENKPQRVAKGLDFAVISFVVAIVLSIGLIGVGVAGGAGMFQGSTFGWTVLGTSVAITVLSFGAMSPATIVTIVLAILGLTGVLPFTSVGIGVAITMTLSLLGGCCCVANYNN